MNRREFVKGASAGAVAVMSKGVRAFAAEGQDLKPGARWPGWHEGEFQFHVIYNGRAESDFCIFPDATSLLIDSGDYKPPRREWFVSALPDRSRGPGEWVARYVERVNPHGRDVDYFLLTHYHADHGGSSNDYTRRECRDGEDYYISGLAETAEFIRFRKAFDRCWPTYDDPIPLDAQVNYDYVQIRRTWEWLAKHRGLRLEKIRLGAVNQIAMAKDAAAYPEFRIRSICANGRIVRRDGTVRDLYADRIAAEHPKKLNENGMSVGLIVEYGPFRLYTAGDFSDAWKLPDGSWFQVEEAQAAELDRVDVAKLNHHGCGSMPKALARALAPQVWLSAAFATHHDDDETLQRCLGESVYPGPRVFAPNIMPAQRLAAARAKGLEWVKALAAASEEEMHVVVTVAPGGKEYSLAFIPAKDESMVVRDVMRFRVPERNAPEGTEGP